MMCPGNIFLGYIFCQRAFHLVGRVVLFCNKPQTVTYAEYMGIYCHCRLAEGHALDDVGRLACRSVSIRAIFTRWSAFEFG